MTRRLTPAGRPCGHAISVYLATLPAGSGQAVAARRAQAAACCSCAALRLAALTVRATASLRPPPPFADVLLLAAPLARPFYSRFAVTACMDPMRFQLAFRVGAARMTSLRPCPPRGCVDPARCLVAIFHAALPAGVCRASSSTPRMERSCMLSSPLDMYSKHPPRVPARHDGANQGTGRGSVVVPT